MKHSFVLLFSFLIGCGAPEKSQIFWGHSTDLDQRFRASDFLFGIEAGTSLHACIDGPSASSEWLKAELFTAVNVWAQAVGRYLPLVFDGCSAAPALRLVFAKAPVSGDFVAYTFFNGERVVYLDPSREWRSSGEILGFDRQPELKSASWQTKARFLFPLVADGSYSSFKLPVRGGKSPQSSLSTLMHELGHAWGLCDLYDARSKEAAFNSNCSTRYRSGSIREDEIMTGATNPGTAHFALSAADKEGLRSLFARPDFSKSRSWGSGIEALESAVLLDKALGAAEAAGELSSEQLKGKVSESPSGAEIRLSFVIEAPLSTTNIFIYESKGRGPFLQLGAEASELRGNRRVWAAAIEVPKENSPLVYLVSAAGLPPLELR